MSSHTRVLRNIAFTLVGALSSAIVGLWIKAPLPRGLLPLLLVLVVLLLLFAVGVFERVRTVWQVRTRHGSFPFKAPQVCILNDLEWKPEGDRVSTGTAVRPSQWKHMLEEKAAESGIKVRVRLVKGRKSLPRYCLVVNPYGGVYPESDLENRTTLRTIFSYVAGGGFFLNVADIPGFWAYSAMLHRRQHATPAIWGVREGGYTGIRPFKLTPFMAQLGLEVLNSEGTSMFEWPAKPHQECASLGIPDDPLAVHRVVRVEPNVVPLILAREIQEAQGGSVGVTPFFAIPYGDGAFIVSLVFQNHDRETNRQMKAVLANLSVAIASRELLGFLTSN